MRTLYRMLIVLLVVCTLVISMPTVAIAASNEDSNTGSFGESIGGIIGIALVILVILSFMAIPPVFAVIVPAIGLILALIKIAALS